MLTRRTLLGGCLAVAGSTLLAGPMGRPSAARAAEGLAPRPAATGPVRHELSLIAAERPARLLGPDGPVSTVWSYDETLLPVVRIRQGDSLRVRLENRLSEHTTIHWHGVRVPNAMDGVQYVTQPPVRPGEDFLYEFTPPDTGTFFFHPHCDETGQVGRGMAGVLIVEGDETAPSDADIVLVNKDWRLAADGSWLPFRTAEGAARAGTFGTRRTVNAAAAFAAEVPARGDIRLRILNLDATRSLQIGVEGAEAYVIATDGNPLEPFRLDSWRLGAAMRVDLLVRAPEAGAAFAVKDYFSAEPWTLGSFTAKPSGKAARDFAPSPLYAPSLPRADLAEAETLPFSFSAAAGSPAAYLDSLPPDDPMSRVFLDALCAGGDSFWAINKQVWPAGDHSKLPPPLATLVAGRSYLFELMNGTPHPHPIHLHGQTMEVISASRQELPRFFADTVLLQPKERIKVAFVAAPGRWMFHCHILEHLEHGMMGWVNVV